MTPLESPPVALNETAPWPTPRWWPARSRCPAGRSSAGRGRCLASVAAARRSGQGAVRHVARDRCVARHRRGHRARARRRGLARDPGRPLACRTRGGAREPAGEPGPRARLCRARRHRCRERGARLRRSSCARRRAAGARQQCRRGRDRPARAAAARDLGAHARGQPHGRLPLHAGGAGADARGEGGPHRQHREHRGAEGLRVLPPGLRRGQASACWGFTRSLALEVADAGHLGLHVSCLAPATPTPPSCAPASPASWRRPACSRVRMRCRSVLPRQPA